MRVCSRAGRPAAERRKIGLAAGDALSKVLLHGSAIDEYASSSRDTRAHSIVPVHLPALMIVILVQGLLLTSLGGVAMRAVKAIVCIGMRCLDLSRRLCLLRGSVDRGSGSSGGPVRASGIGDR